MREEDIAYYTKRARQERERAISCEDNAIALAHLRMADEYDRLLDGKPRETFLHGTAGAPIHVRVPTARSNSQSA